jgi:predicted small metal-binding protein
MFADKALRCDCGYRLRARTEQRQVAEVRRHAWEAHGISFSTDEALAVLLRLELEPDEEAEARLAIVQDPTRRKEQG